MDLRTKHNIFFYHSTDILRQRTKDVEVKKYCIHLLEKLGSFKYTRDILQKLDGEARAEVRTFLKKNSHLFALCLFNNFRLFVPSRYRC